jgi:hypothetical protein
MRFRNMMEVYLTYNDNHIEANEFILREIRVWGDEYVDDLFDKGFIPVKLSNGKWAWLLDTAKSVVLTH